MSVSLKCCSVTYKLQSEGIMKKMSSDKSTVFINSYLSGSKSSHKNVYLSKSTRAITRNVTWVVSNLINDDEIFPVVELQLTASQDPSKSRSFHCHGDCTSIKLSWWLASKTSTDSSPAIEWCYLCAGVSVRPWEPLRHPAGWEGGSGSPDRAAPTQRVHR